MKLKKKKKKENGRTIFSSLLMLALALQPLAIQQGKGNLVAPPPSVVYISKRIMVGRIVKG